MAHPAARGSWNQPLDARRGRRRLRAERPRRSDRAGTSRVLRARARGGRNGGRRRADGGADASRLPPRRLLRHPSARARLAVPPDARASSGTASSGSSRRRRSLTPSTTGRPCSSSAPWRRQRRGSGPTRTPTDGSWRRSSRTPPISLPTSSAPSASRGILCRSPALACSASSRPSAWPAVASRASGPAPSSRGWLRTRSFPSPARRARASASCSACSAITWAGPCRGAARSRSPKPLPPACARSGARSSSADVWNPWPSCRARALCSSTSRRASCSASAAAACPPATGAASQDFATGPARSSSTWPSTARSRGVLPSAPAPAPSTSAERSRRSPRPRPRWPPGGHRSGPTSCSRSRASSIRAGRRPASTRSGLTATCRMGPPST